jgi:hypothetical protein
MSNEQLAIRVINACKSFQKDRQALQAIDVRIDKGECVGLLGASWWVLDSPLCALVCVCQAAVAGALVDGQQYTFELFVSMAILETYRAEYMAAPDVARVLLHQGVPAPLLPVLFAHVPSMHIASGFLPALLEDPSDPGLQAFAVSAAAQLAKQYPLPGSLELARVALVRRGFYRSALCSS